MRSKEERRAALLARFREITVERTHRISQWWLQLEQAPHDEETAAELLREIHTLKGEARTVGLSELGQLAHQLEALLFKARDLGFSVPRAASDAVLRATDALARLVQSDGATSSSFAEEVGHLERAAAALGGAGSEENAAEALARTAAAVPSPAKAHPARRNEAADSVRVRTERIASISDVAGEMVVSQSKIRFRVAQLRQLAMELKNLASSSGTTSNTPDTVVQLLGSGLAELEEAVYQQGLHVREMDRTSRELRLVPVTSLLEPFVRMVRDLALEHGKEVALHLDTNDAEADKRVLDVLGEPLMHVLRNCVDHGIETPSERVAQGKPARGTIRIGVRPSGASLLLEITDDGRGLSPSALRARAVSRGFLTEAGAAALDDQQARELVFVPGFSSRDDVTSTSGRGVGMDIVKRRVEQLGGRLELRSEEGKGLTLTVVVPVSISLTRALIVQVGQHECAVPSASIESVRRLTREDLLEAHGGLSVRVGESLVSAVPLEELLTGGGDPEAELPVGLVLRSGSEQRVVRVARTQGEAELVIKPLGPPLHAFQLVSGAAVLESGKVVLVLDVGTLLSKARTAVASAAVERERDHAAAARILVVDDSVILRQTLVSMLKPLGYQVFEAGDGQEALEQLDLALPDLVFTDIQMPRMDGLALVRAIREQPRLRNLPVVILSSLGAPEDLRRGLDAGAQAYLVKNDLTEEAVAQVILRLLR